MASPKRVCWDACAWIAYIQQEKITDNETGEIEDRYTMCRVVLEQAVKGKIEIAFSACCYAEVCQNKRLRTKGDKQISEFFEHDYLLPVAVDTAVGELARTLMTSSLAGLKPPDAVHVATAAYINSELHTFDRRLLNLDGKVDRRDGAKLKICKPDVGSIPGPLLKEMTKNAKKEDK